MAPNEAGLSVEKGKQFYHLTSHFKQYSSPSPLLTFEPRHIHNQDQVTAFMVSSYWTKMAITCLTQYFPGITYNQ